MHSPRFQSLTARFSPHNLRTSFRRSSTSTSSSSRASSTSSSDRASFVSATSSPVGTINSIVSRQKSHALDHDERPPHILEPRPAATFCSLEERMLSF